MRKLNSSTVVLAMGALSFSTAPAAMASDDVDQDGINAMSAGDEGDLRDFFDAYGVDESTQSNLVESFEQGDPWDSLSGEEPVDVATTTENGVTTEVET